MVGTILTILLLLWVAYSFYKWAVLPTIIEQQLKGNLPPNKPQEKKPEPKQKVHRNFGK